ncbi:MAG: prepilin-type N-terminal cleavage/methylation domain-containing protein [Acidobacteriota bacterium]|nr:prepilin-type N-terminal cleavage/methylation domain-containing protein [Acidobacteriota bacterium]
MQQQRQDERGFTLIETTVALVVMMVVGLGAASLFLFSVHNNAGASARTQALAYAQQMMERVRHLDYDDSALSEGASDWTCEDGDCTDNTAMATATAAAYNSHDMTMNVETIDDIDNANAPRKRITMEFRPNLSGAGNNAEEYWANRPVRVVVVRSAPGLGPYRQ